MAFILTLAAAAGNENDHHHDHHHDHAGHDHGHGEDCPHSKNFFLEAFTEDVLSNGKWVRSSMEKYTEQKVFVKPSPKSASGFEEDKGLLLAEEMRHYGVSTLLPKPFKFENGKELVVQYGMPISCALVSLFVSCRGETE